MRTRRELSTAMETRDRVVRQRFGLRKSLESIFDMTSNCSCQSTTKISSNPISNCQHANVDALSCDQPSAISTYTGFNVFASVVSGVKNRSFSASDIGIQPNHVKDEEIMACKRENGAAQESNTLYGKCLKCHKQAHTAGCLESAVAGLNELIWTINKFIHRLEVKTASLKRAKRMGRSNRHGERRNDGNGCE